MTWDIMCHSRSGDRYDSHRCPHERPRSCSALEHLPDRRLLFAHRVLALRCQEIDLRRSVGNDLAKVLKLRPVDWKVRQSAPLALRQLGLGVTRQTVFEVLDMLEVNHHHLGSVAPGDAPPGVWQ